MTSLGKLNNQPKKLLAGKNSLGIIPALYDLSQNHTREILWALSISTWTLLLVSQEAARHWLISVTQIGCRSPDE